ncbi:uncharacterized protein LOC143567561 [Bidens hawaiensis]|uniref:uncharacterized protein LOC143567561 n=1 Tax=Bidens hawaiensis TaxID=980011 RepID=UPI00404A7913
METTTTENGDVICDDVISKLKDDGDFDKLRIKIIRKIKENEELRTSIVSIVKESKAINRPGVENSKTRQLSDAIRQEVGGKLNEQISAALWEIIRSPDGMNTEITETVRSVYDKLTRPKRARVEHNHSEINIMNPVRVDEVLITEQQKEVVENDDTRDTNNERADGSDDDLDAPPGFG